MSVWKEGARHLTLKDALEAHKEGVVLPVNDGTSVSVEIEEEEDGKKRT